MRHCNTRLALNNLKHPYVATEWFSQRHEQTVCASWNYGGCWFYICGGLGTTMDTEPQHHPVGLRTTPVASAPLCALMVMYPPLGFAVLLRQCYRNM